MAKPIAVIGSDNHLDWAAWEKREGLVGDAFYSFEQLTDRARELDVTLVLAGDTINTKHPDSQTAAFLRGRMDCLEMEFTSFDPGMPKAYVYVTQGQHEAATPPWFEAVHSFPIYAHKRAFKLGGHKCYALDWLPDEQLQEELNNIPKDTEIIFLHQVVEEFMGGIRQCDVSLTQVPYATLCFIGDFHQHKNIEVLNRDGKRMRIYSPGSACMRKIDEPPRKGYYVLYDDLTVKSEWYRTRPVLQPPRIVSVEALDRFVEEVEAQIEAAVLAADADLPEHLRKLPEYLHKLPEHIRKPLLWVHYNDSVDNAWPRIQKAVGNKAYLFKRVHLTETEEKTEKRKERAKRTGRGSVAVLESFIPDKESFVYPGSRRLLEAPEGQWALELQKLRAERGITTSKE